MYKRNAFKGRTKRKAKIWRAWWWRFSCKHNEDYPPVKFISNFKGNITTHAQSFCNNAVLPKPLDDNEFCVGLLFSWNKWGTSKLSKKLKEVIYQAHLDKICYASLKLGNHAIKLKFSYFGLVSCGLYPNYRIIHWLYRSTEEIFPVVTAYMLC